MRIHLLLILFCIPLFGQRLDQSPVSVNPDIDALFHDYNNPKVPGASVLVMQHGEISFAKAYGLANLDTNEAVTVETNFRLASLSKQFTATAVLLLVQDGMLSLETKLVDIIPEFPSYGDRITIRHLLNHLSGLNDYEDLIPSVQSAQVSDQDVLELYKKQHSLSFSAGSQYHYSNGGYVLLGLVVERAAGMKFSDFLYQRVFAPLGMTGTQMYEMDNPNIVNRAYGHSPSGGGFTVTDQSVTSATRGDGGVYTSVEDWPKWEKGIQNNLLLNAELQTLAFSPGTLNDGSKTQYGFGWMLGTFSGLTRQYHTGSTIGFRTAVERYPQKELAVLVLINRANSEPWTIAKKIAQFYF